MEFIIHRVNMLKKLKQIPKEFGCEIDIRTNGSQIILNHDPFKKGDKLSDYLDEYSSRGTLVLNIKETGIEDLVLKEVKKREIKNYFLLDVEFPYLYKATVKGERNIAIRFSEKEPIANLNLFVDKLDWVWIDTITKLPVNNLNVNQINKFKSCLVCPSIWGNEESISSVNKKVNDLGLNLKSIMTNLNQISKWLKN